MRGYEIAEENRPLNSKEREQVVQAAKNSRAVVEFCVMFLLFTGIKAKWASHVVDDFVTKTSNGLHIRLQPGTYECRGGGNNTRGAGRSDWGLKSGSCSSCPEGVFEFPSPRVVPVRDNKAIESISSWFDLYHTTPSQPVWTRACRDLGERIGIHRFSSEVARHSFGVILAEKGFNRYEVAEIMGINKSSVDATRNCSLGA